MKLFLFSDDIEEFLVSANDRNDAFMVVEESATDPEKGKEMADELVMSGLYEYPDDFEFKPGVTAKLIVAERGRGIVSYNPLDGSGLRIRKPLKAPTPLFVAYGRVSNEIPCTLETAKAIIGLLNSPKQEARDEGNAMLRQLQGEVDVQNERLKHEVYSVNLIEMNRLVNMEWSPATDRKVKTWVGATYIVVPAVIGTVCIVHGLGIDSFVWGVIKGVVLFFW